MQNAKLRKLDWRSIVVTRDNVTNQYTMRSVEDTNRFVKKLAKELRGGDVLALSGNLGSGKTTVTQCLAKALGIPQQVTSPTFVLMNIYALPKSLNGITQLCHIDAYRLESARELEVIGGHEYIQAPGTLTVIEWPEKVKKMIPKNVVWISFSLGGTV